MRASRPARVGTVTREGVTLGFEVHGHDRGAPAILLMPTWTIIHTRFWKMQVPYLARHFRVVVYDGPGNGTSDRVTDPDRYTPQAYAMDAAAVLDECDVQRTVVVGLSQGARYALELAVLRQDAVAGLVLVGPALPLAAPRPERADIAERFLDPAPDPPTGWDRYNLAYWRADYGEFASWFFAQVFSEPHSTKGHADAVAWALETTPEVLAAEAIHRDPGSAADALAGLRCPTLVVHGSDDRIIDHAVGAEAARRSNGTLVTFGGSGHMPNLRDPVRFNLLVHDFASRVSP